MKRLLSTIAISALASLALGAQELGLPSFFSDGMVLQQSTDAAIWGTAAPGSELQLSCSWTSEPVRCKAGEDGGWKVTVATPSASYNPQSIRISCTPKGSRKASESLIIKDVMIGEVWLASGQSNMEMPMRGFCSCPVRDAQEYIVAPSKANRIRMFSVRKTQSFEILNDVEGSWKGADASTVAEMSATAFFFANKLNEMLDVPVGILLSAYGGARAEGWMPEDLLRECGDEDLSRSHIDSLDPMHKPFLMYNAMLAPLRGYAIKGFIWYQGCSNVGADKNYADRMSKLVKRWRSDWNCETLPFYQVEIAPCSCYSDGPDGYSSAALLRQAQHDAAKSIPYSGIAVTCDLVEPYEAWNIHPARKKPVGDRLAYLALHNDYGYAQVSCNSPEALYVKRLDDTGKIAVKISEIEYSGLDHHRGVEGLEIRTEDGEWHKVSKADYSWERKMYIIHEREYPHPVEVRYCWGAFKPGNLHSCMGLPLAPFCLKVED